MNLEGLHINTSILLEGTLLFALLDAMILPLLTCMIKPNYFKQIKWIIVVVSGFTWFTIWKSVLSWFWDSAYRYVFPAWGRAWLPYLFGSLMAIVSLGLWWLAGRQSRYSVLVFCISTGVWGIMTHTWAIHMGIMSKPPLLQGASPLAALVLAFFEYIFYWCFISLISSILGKIPSWMKTIELRSHH